MLFSDCDILVYNRGVWTACYVLIVLFFFFFKQKTAYEMRISDWSSDVCSSDLPPCFGEFRRAYSFAPFVKIKTRQRHAQTSQFYRDIRAAGEFAEDRKSVV